MNLGQERKTNFWYLLGVFSNFPTSTPVTPNRSLISLSYSNDIFDFFLNVCFALRFGNCCFYYVFYKAEDQPFAFMMSDEAI